MGLKLSDLFENTTPIKKKVVAEYLYKDLEDNLIHKTIRYAPKGFTQARPDGNGGFIYNLNGITPILYNLKELQRARNENLTVFIVEGEKDVETLQKNNVVSTTCAMGAGKWKTTYNEHFKNVSVVIIPDNDDIGKLHALYIAKSLYKIARDIKIIDLKVNLFLSSVSDLVCKLEK